MKKLITLIMLFGFYVTKANQTEKIIPSKVKNVTVFLQGAQVFREGRTSILPGTSTVIFDDISPCINPKSIQASASNGALVLDVKHSIFYPEPMAIKPKVLPERIQIEINNLEDSITLKRFELDMVTSIKNNLMNEKNLIIQNKTMRGEGKSDSLPVLIDAVNFYRDRMEEIEIKLFNIKLKEHKLSANFEKLNARLNELKNYNNKVEQPVLEKKKKHRITVTLNCKESISSTVKINYLVNNAGWYPSYDLRASANKDIQLTYKASVFQRTEENWDNINLKLSTYNQNCSFSIPFLAPWKLTDKNDHVVSQSPSNTGYQLLDSTMSLSNALIPQQQKTPIKESFRNPLDDFLSSVANNQMQSALNNIEFDIDQNYTILPDGKEILMVVKNENLKTDYKHLCIPKINPDVFLLGQITGWEKMNLLHANANIYFNNTFVGETKINPNVLTDTLEIALAREKGVVVSRKKIKDDDKKSNLGKNISREITIELAIKNNKNTTEKVNLKDQIPVSKQKGVSVKLLEDDGAMLNDESGLLSWELDLPPNKTKIITFTYRVDYQKDMDVL